MSKQSWLRAVEVFRIYFVALCLSLPLPIETSPCLSTKKPLVRLLLLLLMVVVPEMCVSRSAAEQPRLREWGEIRKRLIDNELVRTAKGSSHTRHKGAANAAVTQPRRGRALRSCRVRLKNSTLSHRLLHNWRDIELRTQTVGGWVLISLNCYLGNIQWGTLPNRP